jgi:rare lipoprotein A
VAPVEVERLTHEAIRTGAWRSPEASRALAAAPAARTPAPLQASAPSPAVAQQASSQQVASQQAAPQQPAAAQPAVTPPELPAGGVSTVAIAPSTDAPAPPSAADDDAVDAPRAPARPIAAAEPGFWLQLGAFRERDGAFDFQRKVERELDWLAPLMAVFIDRGLHRLQAGPYPSRAEAAGAAERLRVALQLVPLIVERR